jgi:uncharacterized paraquat-inducible protein A
MTVKQVFKVDLMEIPHLEITCISCGGSITIPIPSSNPIGAMSCPGCNRRLYDEGDNPRRRHVAGIIHALSNWKSLEEKGFTLNFSIAKKE